MQQSELQNAKFGLMFGIKCESKENTIEIEFTKISKDNENGKQMKVYTAASCDDRNHGLLQRQSALARAKDHIELFSEGKSERTCV
jgi:hypothetical protein